jgi:hypothetical protein
MVNPPLASTAVGVVGPPDAGMASGINTTFRQIGIATSVAALGSIFATKLIGSTSATVTAHYASALNELLLITAILALGAGLITMLLVRQKDFAHHGAPTGDPAPEQAAETTQLALTPY